MYPCLCICARSVGYTYLLTWTALVYDHPLIYYLNNLNNSLRITTYYDKLSIMVYIFTRNKYCKQFIFVNVNQFEKCSYLVSQTTY